MNVRWLSSNRALVAAFVAALLTVVLLTVLVVRQRADASNSQLYLETAGGVGANPFVPLSPDAPKTAGGEVDPEGGFPPASAGTDNIGTCDPGKLAAYLGTHPEKASAWAQALNSDPTLTWSGGEQVALQQIPAYISELTSRVLTEDLRVTNYQFTNGSATAVQAVLQNGTAVLVDAKGVSRVRCACGNPLAPMIRLSAQPKYLGTPWPGFQPPRITIIERPPQLKHVPRSQPEPQLEAEPQPKNEPRHEPKPRPEPRLEHRAEREPQPVPMSGPKPKHEPKHESKPELKPKPEAKPEPKSNPETKPKPESKSEPKPKPEPQPKHEPTPKPEPKAKSKPKPEPKPETKPKPEPKPETKPKPEPKPETKPKPEPKPETKPKPGPKPETKPKPGPKPET